MKTTELIQKLQGTATIQEIENKLKVDRTRAIYLIYRLRKKGYVKTYYGKNKKRFYDISLFNPIESKSYESIINKYAPLGTRIVTREPYFVHGRKIEPEEALIYAIQRQSIRYIIASLSLFRRIKWPMLYKLAKKQGLLRHIGALYDVARLILPKLQKMPNRFKNNALPKKRAKYIYIKYPFRTKHFNKIEKKWKTYIPLNWDDLSEYKLEY